MLGLGLALLALCALVYAPGRGHEFVNVDDLQYVRDNPQVAAGLTRAGVAWAFTTGHAGNWHPLTWLSHMLDVQLFGLAPGAHHVTSALLHAATTLLWFGLLLQTTGAALRSAFVAALFAVHPLHVESVAWVAERKDVLSTLLGVLALWSHVAYVRRPGLGRRALVFLLFASSLMAKPMLVTWPLVMLLFDFWPLRRLVLEPGGSSLEGLRRLVVEKLPLLALSLASCLVTFGVQQQAGAVRGFEALPLEHRLANALVSYVVYLGQAAWPLGLAAHYPYPRSLPAWQVAAAAAVLVAVSALALRAAHRHPYFPVGWFFYLATLVPVIGLIQVGTQARADRYTYVPLVGVFLVLAWGIAELPGGGRARAPALRAAAALAILACTVVARAQVSHWKNSVTLWQHALEATADNARAHHNLGHALAARGDLAAAITHYREALRLQPEAPETHNNLGHALAETESLAEAIAHYAEALRLAPDYAEARNNLGLALLGRQRADDAIGHLSEAARLTPRLAAPRNNLGVALLASGRPREALAQLTEALRIEPGYREARANLALAHNALGVQSAEAGSGSEAIAHWREAARLDPALSDAHANLGRALAGEGRTEEALRELREALLAAPGQADLHYDIGVLLNREGREREALEQLDAALRLDPGHRPARQARDALAQRAGRR